MDEFNIKKSLRQCRKAAGNGSKMAMKQYRNLNDTLTQASSKIESTLIDINTSSCYVSEATDSLTCQLSEIRDSMGFVTASLVEDISTLHEDLEKFSVTLFGRTMAGKSTLMEVLTDGDGASIGKGSQRTTKDVRTYTWNNLEITDVPGIGAFEGEDDERLAFWAARKADLILFLLSDDAPQVTEAECFSEIVNLGKPIICVMNVKSSIRDGESEKMTLRNLEKAFNQDRLNAIRNQFLKYANEYGQDWSDIPFVFAHLKAAYMGLKSADAKIGLSLTEASRINDLKQAIITDVETHGKYYREKNFVDIVSVPTLDIFESLLFRGAVNINLHKVVSYKHNQLNAWTDKFKRDSLNAIESLIETIKAELSLEIPSFSEEHFDDKNADKAWSHVLVEHSVEERCKELSERIASQAEDRLNELAREISNELKYVSTLFNRGSFQVKKMHKIFDARKAWNWGSLVAGGGLTIASGILYILGSAAAGPVGWVALGVGAIGTIGSFLFKSKNKKEDKARKQLEESLSKNLESICVSLQQQLEEILNGILEQQIIPQSNELSRIASIISQLSETQYDLAKSLQQVLLEQNMQVFSGALKLLWAGKYSDRVIAVGRVPGKIMDLVLHEDLSFPKKKIDKIDGLIQEQLELVNEHDDYVESLLGFGPENRRQDGNVIKINIPSPTAGILNRIRVVQQLTGLYIENVKEVANA